jgi:hypothetical protein
MMQKEGEPDFGESTPPEWELDHGWEYLRRAVELWDFLNDAKGEKLGEMIRGELREQDAEGQQVMALEQVRRILALLDGLEPALRLATLEHYDLRPEDVERAMKTPKMVTRAKREDGRIAHTTCEALAQVSELEHFLRRALQEGRTILID